MTAYATAEPLASEAQLRHPDPQPPAATGVAKMVGGLDAGLIDQLLGRLADLVADRLVERTLVGAHEPPEEWLDTRRAAEYLGVHRDTIRKLAAERAIPTHQDGPGCKLYFRRDELDDWRRTARPSRRSSTTRLRAVS